MARIGQIESTRPVPVGASRATRNLINPVGVGVSNLGRSATNIEQAKDRAWALEQTVALRQRSAERATELADTIGPGAAGYEETLGREFDAEVARIGDSGAAPSSRAMRLFSERATLLGSDVRSRARGFEVNERTNQTIDSLADSIDRSANMVRDDATQYEDIRADVLGVLEGAEDSLPPEAMRGLRDTAEQTLAIGALNRVIETDPDTALSALRSGDYDERLTPGQKDALIGQADREVEKRQREAEAARVRGAAEYAEGFADYDAYLRGGGAPTEAYGDEEIRASVKPELAEEIITARDRAEAIGADVAAIELATPEQIGELVDSRVAGLDSPEDYRANAGDLSALATAIGERRRALENDPAAYAQRQPEVEQSWAALQAAQGLMAEAAREAPGDAAMQARLQGGVDQATRAYVTATTAEQLRLGVPPGWTRVLSEPAAAGAVQMYRTLQGEAAAQMLMGQAAQWGDAWPRVNGELVDAGLPPVGMVIGTMTDRTQAWAAGRLAEIADIDTADLRQQFTDDQVKAMNGQVVGGLSEFRQSLANVPGSQPLYNAFEEQALRLTYDLSRNGASDAAESAVNALVASQYEFGVVNGQTLRIPVAQDPDGVLTGARMMLENPGMLGDIVIGSQTPGLAPDQAQEIYRDIIEGGGYWVTNGDETGAMLYEPGGGLVFRRDGQPVVYDWRQLSEFGQAAMYMPFFGLVESAETGIGGGIAP